MKTTYTIVAHRMPHVYNYAKEYSKTIATLTNGQDAIKLAKAYMGMRGGKYLCNVITKGKYYEDKEIVYNPKECENFWWNLRGHKKYKEYL